MRDRLITQRIFFFGMVAILAILALILVWQFTRAILLGGCPGDHPEANLHLVDR